MNIGIIIVIAVVAFFILKNTMIASRKRGNITRYGNEFGELINHGKIAIGMTKEMVTAAIGTPGKSDGITHKENYVKEVLYYGAFTDVYNKVHYKFKVTYVNDKVNEFHEFQN